MMDLQCALSVQEGDDSKEPAVTLTAPSLPEPLILKPFLLNSELVESHAVSMTNTDSMPTLPSSPAEACLAKLAITSPTTNSTTDGGTVVDKSPTTSDIASASDSLASTGTSLAETTTTTTSASSTTTATTMVEAAESSPPPAFVALSVDPFQRGHSPAMLRFKGITVTLENNSVWKQFHSYGTEMILTKSGRRMFPYCRYKLSGLNPSQRYSLVLSIVPADQHKYRWNTKKWEVIGAAEYQAQGLIRAFPHQYSPCLGSEWMKTMVSFYKLKLTNNMSDQEGHMILHSMHRYIPRLHIIPVLDGDGPTPDQPVIKGPESMTFTFPQTEFVTVTTYQNPWIIQLKINHNPFAKGFREEGIHPRLCKPKLGDSQGTKEAQDSPAAKPADDADDDDDCGGAMEISLDKTPVACTTKPTHQTPLSDAREPHAEQPESARTQGHDVPVSEEAMEVVSAERSTPIQTPSPTGPPKRPRGRPRKRLSLDMSPALPRAQTTAAAPAPSPHVVETRSSRAPVVPEDSDEDYTTTPASFRKKKRPNKKWGNSRGRGDGKSGGAAAASPAVAGPAQPESDDVEGLLFVSFTSKEALGLHLGDRGTGNTRSASAQDSPVSLRMTLDPTGGHLPLPRTDLPGRGNTTPLSPTVGGAAFVSRTGKTSDLTKIKGWRDKFIKRSKESSAQQDGSQKDLSAFCSNMLDEYLENEAQQISERAAAFSASPEAPVAYQLPEKSSSYVKTLDSVLKHRSPAAAVAGVAGAAAAPLKAPLRANRPCPLSMKPLLYSVLTSPAPPLKTLDRPVAPKAKSPRPKPATPKAGPDAAKGPAAPGGVKALPISLWFPADKTSPAPASQGSQSSSRAGPGQKAGGPGWGQLQANLQGKGLSKVQLRMLSMEETLQNQGTGRTSLTPERLDFAMSALLTATMKHKQSTVAQYPMAPGPACGQLFCRLGCVCSSLARVNRGPLHCRRPDCMLGCDCFKRKIVKQLLGGEDETPPESQSNPLYAVKSLQHEVQPSPGAHWDRIWHKELALPDPEPLYAPKSLDSVCYSSRRPVYQHVQPIQEKDKDPVYRYLESLMTCARIREFRTSVKVPAKTNTESPRAPLALKSPAPASVLQTQPKKTQNVLARKFPNIILTFKNTGKNSTMDNDSLDSQQIEILSECHWDDDRKLILGALCQRMKRGSLATPFCAGPYHVSLIAKILRPRATGSTISYKMRICRLKAASEEEEDGDDSSDEEEVDENDSDDGEIRSSCEEEEEEDEEKRALREKAALENPFSLETTEPMGVTPFLSRVLPAGILQAKRKPTGSSAVGLVQVNGKSYPQACLMLGHVGSLHPANRLAAYVTGRLSGATKPQKPPVPPAQKTTSPRIPPRPAAAVKEEPKTKAKAVVESDGGPPQPPPASRPVTTFRTRGLGSTAPACSTSFSSPVSITVSRSLKEPSFLAERGTYSFRICPPAANQGAGSAGAAGPARHPAGVSLPGGFTLIQLPKHGANGALALPVDPDRFPSASVSRGEAQVKVEVCADAVTPGNDVDVDEVRAATEDQPGAGALEAGSSPPKLECDEKMQSGDSDDSLKPKTEDRPPEDEESAEGSSDSEEVGDLSEEGGLVDVETVEDESVDVETVEDMTQSIEELKKSVSGLSRSIWDSSEESGSSMESKSKPTQPPPFVVEEEEEEEEMEEEQDLATGHRRRQHKVLERLRRMEQRDLFIKLQTLLRTDPKAPKLRLLSQAQSEIQTLVETSKALEKQKKKLCEMQKLYVRRISCLAGKPEDLIRRKLKEVYERKQLLNGQKKGPIALNKSPQLGVRGPAPPPALSYPPHQLPRPRVPVPIAPFPSGATPARGSPPRWQPKDLPQGPAAEQRPRDQVTGPPAREKKPKEKGAPKGPPVAIAPSEPSEGPTLPLIRTKTGRIILPSSLKPLGQGFYTITIMEPDKEKAGSIEPGEVVLPTPSVPNAATDQPSKQDGVTGEEEPASSSSPAGDEAAAAALSPRPVPLGSRKSMSPLVEIARLNKSISSSSASQSLLLRNDGGSGIGGASESNGTSRLSFSPCSLVYIPLVPDAAKGEPSQDAGPGTGEEASPSVPRRRRGRPRKHPLVSPANQTADDAAVDESMEAGEGGSPDKTEEEGDSPVLVKRGRGRPPKKRPLGESDWAGGSPPVKAKEATPKSQGRSRPTREVWKSPDKARSTRTAFSPDLDQEGGTGSGKRPLTRGALGKDFPSAKRRSWIDVEKELGLD